MADPADDLPRSPLAPSRTQLVLLVAALCFLAGVVGWWIGRPGDPSFNDVDRGFLTDMTEHHSGAVTLGFAYLGREHDSVVGHFAREIVVDQSQEISLMNALLADAGGAPDDRLAMRWMGMPVAPAQMPGMPTAAELASLRAASGVAADDAFTRLMVRHHAAGVAMARYAEAHGENDAVRRLARAMARVQRIEIRELEQRRSALGLRPVDTSDLDDLHGH